MVNAGVVAVVVEEVVEAGQAGTRVEPGPKSCRDSVGGSSRSPLGGIFFSGPYLFALRHKVRVRFSQPIGAGPWPQYGADEPTPKFATVLKTHKEIMLYVAKPDTDRCRPRVINIPYRPTHSPASNLRVRSVLRSHNRRCIATHGAPRRITHNRTG